ncbi:MAG TPA: NADH-quinone oxidoreductase subunit J [Candidatus Sulfotelmatobacter sp.]|nr:NADH-quinone oxidoreductase subunit J [Candidatus Sulfotelmatobacter sp.]
MQMTAGTLHLALGIGAFVCALRAIVSRRILASTIYLACVSALVSTMLYLLGAFQVAVMELSVGAGLVTVLMVYAISVTGDATMEEEPLVPRGLAVVLALAAIGLLALMAVPLVGRAPVTAAVSLKRALWEQRVLDVWIQIVLIFSGVLGILGMLSEARRPKRHPAPAGAMGQGLGAVAGAYAKEVRG